MIRTGSSGPPVVVGIVSCGVLVAVGSGPGEVGFETGCAADGEIGAAQCCDDQYEILEIGEILGFHVSLTCKLKNGMDASEFYSSLSIISASLLDKSSI